MHPASCPACDCRQSAPISARPPRTTLRCGGCGLIFAGERPAEPSSAAPHASGTLGTPAARACVNEIAARLGGTHGHLLVVGSPDEGLSREATERGFRVTSVTGLDAAELQDAHLDACICLDMIGRVGDPVGLLQRIHRLLTPEGVLWLQTPLAPTGERQMIDEGWCESHPDAAQYFSAITLPNVIARAGFRRVDLTLRGSGTRRQATVIGRAAPVRRRPLLSIVVPAYNEGSTIRGALDRLIAKPLADLDKEIIVVESNSTDGTREAVLEYRDRPDVRVVLTERPSGKGHAVRQGLEHATGDFVIIQDADDEYDINDYDALLEPLRTFRQAFVLGTRHQGHWRIRNFGEPSSITVFMNSGHVLLTEFFNLLYRQSLTDPWTMYKVFRRDCLHGVHLECNRFDFDVELVAKLVRRGFSPLEIPVRYHSRSFAEGKKIRVFRDPLTWLWACVKYRVVSFRSRPVRG